MFDALCADDFVYSNSPMKSAPFISATLGNSLIAGAAGVALLAVVGWIFYGGRGFGVSAEYEAVPVGSS
jgi:hypothetical protein